MAKSRSLASLGMTIVALVLFLFSCVVPFRAHAQTTPYTVTGNVKSLANAGPSSTTVRMTLVNADTCTPKVDGVAFMGEKRYDEKNPDATTGAFTFTLFGNPQIACGGVTDTTRWQLTFHNKTTGALIWTGGKYRISANTDLNTAPEVSPTPPSIGPDYALRSAGNTFATGTQDFTAATVTRPFKSGTTAAKDAITNCTAGKDYFSVTDPAGAGQNLFVCNAAGNGWDQASGAGGGGVIGPGTAGKLAKFTGVGSTVGDSLLSESGDVVSMAGDFQVSDTEFSKPAFSTPQWEFNSGPTHYARQVKVGGSLSGGTKPGSSSPAVYLSEPKHGFFGNYTDSGEVLRVDMGTANGGMDVAEYAEAPDTPSLIAAGANRLGPTMLTVGFSTNANCLSGPGNHVATYGINNSYGSAPVNYFWPSLSLNIEANYQPVDCDHSKQEMHAIWTSPQLLPDGSSTTQYDIRPFSTVVNLNRTNNTADTTTDIGGNLIYFFNPKTSSGGSNTTHTTVDSSGNWVMTGTVQSAGFTGPLTGNVTGNVSGTATALAANPADCSAGQYATTIDASGNLTCAQVGYAQISGTPTLPANTTATASQFFTAYNSTTGAFTKAQPAFSDLTGAATDAQIPNNITIDLAATATALASNPTDCSANNFATAIDASGNLACAQPTYSNLAAGTATNMTMDAEGTGNTITVPAKVWLPAASVAGGTATLIWDSPSSTPAVAAAVNGTNTIKGVADFADTAGGFSLQTTELLPADFTGNIDAKIVWLTSATTGNVKWSLSTVCTATDATETDDPAFNAASTVTTAAPGTTLRIASSTITGVTATGCAAGELLHLKIFRDGNDASDTIAATARLVGVELTFRRAM